MALLTITAGDVGVGSLNSSVRVVQVGEAVSQGEPGYRNTANGKHYRGDASDADKDAIEYIFLTAAGVDGYALAAVAGASIKIGATLTVGTAYYLASTVGRIGLESDLSSGNYVTLLGVATSTELLTFQPVVTGVAKA